MKKKIPGPYFVKEISKHVWEVLQQVDEAGNYEELRPRRVFRNYRQSAYTASKRLNRLWSQECI